MASSGQITLYIESVDYPSGRGHYYSNLIANWSVSDSGYLTLSEDSYNTNYNPWWICSSAATDINNYYVKWEVQFKPTGENWQSLYSNRVAVLGPCSNYDYTTGTNVKNMMEAFCSGFPGAQLTKSGELRVICGANKNPNPDAGYPYAFPNDVYSETSQVPVYIDVNWTATIKYNANGGSGAPSDQTHSQAGDSYTFTVSNTIPTRTNYRFDGWAYNGNTYHGGDNITVYKATPTITLVAQWTRYYRPGATLSTAGGNNVWYSNEKTNGACHVLSDVDNVTWKEMRTIDGASGGQGDPPLILHAADSDSWYNQKKLGKTS